MSMYGPPGGPYPGQPQDPWEAQSRREGADDAGYQPENYASEQEWSAQGGGGYSQQPYRSGYDYPRSYTSGYDNPGYDHPNDAGYADPSYADPRYGDQNYGDQSFGPGREAPGGASGQPPRRGRGPLIAAVVIVSLLVVGGVGSYLLYQGRQHDVASGPRPGAPVSAGPHTNQPSVNASAAPGGGAGSGGQAGPDGDAFTAKAGDCLVNRGDEGHPEMKKVPCGPNTYQVLKRIDGTADKTRCNGTPNLTDWYFYDHPDNSRDFVLCLHKR